MESELKKSLDEKIQELSEELERKGHKIFDEDELWKSYKESVREYSKMGNGEVDDDFVDRQFRNVSFIIKTSTTEFKYYANIIDKIVVFKLAKIIFQHELKITDFQNLSLQEKRDQAEEKAHAYYWRNEDDIDLNFDPNEEKPTLMLFKILYPNYFNTNQGMVNKSSGCMLLISSIITLSLVIMSL